MMANMDPEELKKIKKSQANPGEMMKELFGSK